MKIGVIGLGVVGSAVYQGLEVVGHTVYKYDIKLPKTSIKDILPTELCFVCVPTPPASDGSCDVSIVESVIKNLISQKYKGLIVIKSTVNPGTTERLSKKYKREFSFCPEFLKERSAFADFVEHHDICVVGTNNKKHFNLIKKAHGSLPKNFVQLTPTEAELSKYFSNIFNALKVTFANEFYEICCKLKADYTSIKEAISLRSGVDSAYLDCNKNMRGFGGVCLPKDTLAFASMVEKINPDMKLFRTIVEENKKFKTTIIEGMRFS